MKAITGILFWACLLVSGLAGEVESPTLRVRVAMKDIEAGNFCCKAPMMSSGWFMTNEYHQVFQRSFLQAQGQPIIAIGPEAVPELIKWLGRDNMHVRYIAHYCLEQITGEEPYFPHFATLRELRSKAWLKAATRTWSEWYTKKTKASR